MPIILLTVVWLAFGCLLLGLLYAIKYALSYKRNSYKLKAEIIGFEEHNHEADEDCCGPATIVLKARSEDGRVFEKHVFLSEKEELASNKQIIVYVKKKNPNKFYFDLQSAE